MIFVLDTNALWELGAVRRLGELARSGIVRLQVSALVHAERVAQVRRRHGATFDLGIVRAFIDTHRIEVVAFDRESAEDCAEVLCNRFSTDDAWSAAKRARCATRFHVAADAGAACPATVDWFIAHGHARSTSDQPVYIVTNDAGGEFAGPQVLSLVQAVELAETAVARSATSTVPTPPPAVGEGE